MYLNYQQNKIGHLVLQGSNTIEIPYQNAQSSIFGCQPMNYSYNLPMKSQYNLFLLMQKERNSDSHPIKIDFINYQWPGSSAQLGITFAPGKKQKNAMTGSWNRDLNKDVDRIAHYYKISTLVSMVELEEMKELAIEAEFEECKKRGIQTFHFPIEDNNIPSDVEGFIKLAKEIVDNHLRKNRSVVVHCKGGLGRAPTLVLACLLYSKVSFQEGVKIIRAARSHSLNCSNQLDFLSSLKL